MQDSQRWSFSCGPQSPRFAQYLAAVQQLDQLAQNRFGKHVVSAGDLLDDRSRHHYRALGRAPSQPTGASRGGSRLAARCRAKSEIDRILRESVSDPVGPEFHGAGIAQGAWHNWQRSTAIIGGIRAPTSLNVSDAPSRSRSRCPLRIQRLDDA
jgi:hypothetical protein